MRVPPGVGDAAHVFNESDAVKLFGASKPSLGSIWMILGYHSLAMGAIWLWTQSFNSGASEVSIAIWYFASSA